MSGRRDFPWPPERRNLEREDLSYRKFVGFRMPPGEPGMSFKRATLKGSMFKDVTFHGCDFRHAHFGSTEVEDATFEDCTFDFFELSNSSLRAAAFLGGQAESSSLLESRLVACRFQEMNCTGMILQNNVFESCQFEGFLIPRASVENNYFHDCEFRRCDLADQTFVWCILSECRFEDVQIGIEILTTCTGFTLESLRGARVMDDDREIPHDELPGVLLEIYQDQLAKGELAIAANVASVLGRLDLLEGAIERVQDVLEEPDIKMTGVYWVRLVRKLIHWAGTGALSPYWLSWTYRALSDHARSRRAKGELVEYHLVEAATLLFPIVREHQMRLAQTVAAERPRVRLDAPVEVTVRVRDGLTLADVVDLVEDLERTARAQTGDAHARPLFPFTVKASRRGSLEVDAGTIALGYLIIQQMLSHADTLIARVEGVAHRALDARDRIGRRLRASPRASGAAAPQLPTAPVHHIPSVAMTPSPGSGEGSLAERADSMLIVDWISPALPTPSQARTLNEVEFSILLRQ